jgi:LysM repeat protein
VLSVIAEKHGVPLAALRKVNGVASDTIRPGQVLLLPTAYEVKPGDALGIIAERFGVELSELLRHNELNEDSVLKVGQRVIIAGGSRVQHSSTTAAERKPAEPKVEYYEHEVRRNEVLSVIAARYEIPTKDLCRINRLGNASLIRVGQHLKIPITDQNEHLTRPKPWSKYARRNFERGKVTLQTLGGTVWTGRVFDEKGNILPAARKRIQSLLASWETGRRRQVALHPRLYELIVTVSDEFGGRPLRIVSGYRQRSYARHSKHRVGRALDFSIPGVPNSAVVDFLLTVPKTGVGYYPNTTHVHMDARSSRMYWVDVSGPGQPPRYVHKSTTGERAPEYASGPTAALHLGSSASSGAMARLGTKRQR